MLPDYPIHRIFCFIGVGRNGKSKCIELIKRFIGEKNVCSTDLDILLNSRFEAAKLYHKLVCIMGETNFDSIKRTSILKRLTGQDTTGFEFKNKTPFDTINYAKIIIATNSLPITEDKTDGFYRRWQIIRFPNQFNETKDPLQEIPEYEYMNLAKKCIRILKELLQKREFTNEGSVEYRKAVYEDNSDAVKVFIEHECDIDSVNAEISFQEFYAAFKAFCESNGLRVLTAKKTGSLLYEIGLERYNKNIGTTSVTTIRGLRLKKETALW
jgi:putative DNA primase/helicase